MQQQKSKQFTYQTRINSDNETNYTLISYATHFSSIERKLFTDLIKNKELNSLKKDYIKNHEITARQFNSCRMQIEGKIKSYEETRQLQIASLNAKIIYLEKQIPKYLDKNKIHQKKRKLFNLRTKLEKLKNETKPKICFGSKKLFNAQFHLGKNGFKNFEEWKTKWQSSRNNSFFIVGSKDETTGNQSCQISKEGDCFSLKLRLPNSCSQKYLIIKNVNFNYGKSQILDAIESNAKRKQLQNENNPSYKDYGKAINYRFLKDEKGFRVFITIEIDQPKYITKKEYGVIGVDINADQLAITEVDRFSNPIDSKKIPLNLYGKSKNQSSSSISEACKIIIEQAKETKKPIVIEDLNFQKKKATLKETYKRYARMLSSLSYSLIICMLISKAFRSNIEIFFVNPAYTSVIGKVKFAKRYGLSKHQSAALAIGRRFMKASEKPPHQSIIPDAKGSMRAFFLPARNRKKHLWSYWKLVSEILKTVAAPHFRATRC